MDPDSFSLDQRKHLLRVGRGSEGYRAFVPPPLPPAIDWSEDLIGLLSAADRALGQLAGLGRSISNPHLLIGPFKRREAVLSSRIEGTQASLADLVLFEARNEPERDATDVVEVRNYVRAMDHCLERQATLPISKRLLCEAHGILMDGVRGHHLAPGEFRRSQNWIGPPGCTLADATYVPPPPDRMTESLDQFEKYLHSPSRLPTLVRLAAIHYQFEAIHPFLDGNGRIGRLLIAFLLCAEGALSEPLLYLSAYFEKHRTRYYDSLLNVSLRGNWDDWIRFFLRGVSEQAMDAVERATKLVTLRETYHARFHSARSSALLLKLVDALFDLPAITASSARNLLQVTPASVHKIITRLVEAGILREVTGNARNRVWVADEIRQAVE